MRVLLIEDDVALREAIAATAIGWELDIHRAGTVLRDQIREVSQCGSVLEGRHWLEQHFDIMIVDVRLQEESGLDLVRYVNGLAQRPVILAVSGKATAKEAFELGALGVSGYLGKPFDMHELRQAIQGVVSQGSPLETTAMAQVGRRPIHAVQDEVKSAMLKRALQLESGNITHAARRLGVTRAAVQQMLDRYELPRDWGVPGKRQ
jgi:DNA-binding NtrC family response regulator